MCLKDDWSLYYLCDTNLFWITLCKLRQLLTYSLEGAMRHLSRSPYIPVCRNTGLSYIPIYGTYRFVVSTVLLYRPIPVCWPIIILFFVHEYLQRVTKKWVGGGLRRVCTNININITNHLFHKESTAPTRICFEATYRANSKVAISNI